MTDEFRVGNFRSVVEYDPQAKEFDDRIPRKMYRVKVFNLDKMISVQGGYEDYKAALADARKAVTTERKI